MESLPTQQCTEKIARPGRRSGAPRCVQPADHPSGRCVYHRLPGDEPDQPGIWANPSGRCVCGCGKPTKQATAIRRAEDGTVLYRIGEYLRCAQGHGRRLTQRPLADRLAEVVDKNGPGGCWLFLGCLCPQGYGVINAGSGRNTPAHRASYEIHVGPIPEGLQLDHLCRVRNCVNPSHLEPVTKRENVLRAVPSMRAAAKRRAAVATHCRKGHSYAEHGTVIRNGWRRCNGCLAEAARRQRVPR